MIFSGIITEEQLVKYNQVDYADCYSTVEFSQVVDGKTYMRIDEIGQTMN